MFERVGKIVKMFIPRSCASRTNEVRVRVDVSTLPSNLSNRIPSGLSKSLHLHALLNAFPPKVERDIDKLVVAAKLAEAHTGQWFVIGLNGFKLWEKSPESRAFTQEEKDDIQRTLKDLGDYYDKTQIW